MSESDPHNNVNAKHYLDIIASARLNFLERELKVSFSDILEKGFGFFLKKAMQNFKRPIIGLKKIYVRSFVSQLLDTAIIVDFEILDDEQKKQFANGQLEYTIVDLQTQRPVKMPEWMMKYFFVI